MRWNHLSHRLALAFVIVTLLTVIAGCSLSNRQPSTNPSPAEPVEGGGIPPDVLTAVAATLYAPLQGTLTQQAAAPQAAKPITPSPMMEQPRPTEGQAPGQPTPAEPPAATTAPQQPPVTAPTQAQPNSQPPQQPEYPATRSGIAYAYTPTYQAPALPLVTMPAGQGYGFPPPVDYVPAFPAGGYTADAGAPFAIGGVNLPACGSTFTANFLIINQSGSPFESLSVQLNDLTTGQVLSSGLISDAPFMFDDRVCFPGGISRLESGYALFAGVPLAVGQLSRHSLQASLLFCSQNGLGGKCFSKSVEFVVP